MHTTTAIANGASPDEPDLSDNEVFEMLANRRRRFVIHALKGEEEPMDVSELSRRVTAWEVGVEPDAVEYEDRRNVYSTLRRTHLPKLEEKDVITVDDEGTVRPTPALESLDVYVEVLEAREVPWNLYYLGLAGVAGALLLAVATGVPGLAGLSPLAVGAFTVAAFGVSAVVHRVVGRRTRLGTTEKPPEVRRRD
ncbi:hypothetical protein GCM10027435_20860 [Haloparvum alkalitolerans]|uniref:DUF7344 domain-containing protein n=1 Tax=Haloparvum alkalitolerans TaxID=1042953 RepID=UPI003CF6DA16